MIQNDVRKRVAVVDDAMEDLWLSQLALEGGGYEVLMLSDCEELLVQIKLFKPGLIFMDHWMPAMSGIEATRLLKGDVDCRHIPVIYFSAWENIRQLAQKAGADDWLCKPFLMEEMRGMAAKYL